MSEATKLRRELRAAGLSSAAITAAWPEWWSDSAENSVSAKTELRLAVARNLGLSPKALVGERVDFVWRDKARFKHLASDKPQEVEALNSFGTSMASALTSASNPGDGLEGISAKLLRSAIVADHNFVNLPSLLAACWALGVPVAHLKVWPLKMKAMHAMVAARSGRHAIMLSRDTSYMAAAAFTLAHEMGHVALGHVVPDGLLVDAEEPGAIDDNDQEENEADRYALEVLTGDPEPDVALSSEAFNAPMLADAATRAGAELGIDPGTIALIVGHRRRAWPVAMAALRFIQPEPAPVGSLINQVAEGQLDLSRLGSDNASFVRRVMDLPGV